MSASSLPHRRAERFASILDAPDGDATGPVDARLEELLVVVEALRVVDDAPAADAGFVADLRSRLMVEADTALLPAEDRLLLGPHRTRRRRSARLVAASAALVVAGGTAGVAVAAEHSLPGAPIYVVKQGLEGASRALALNQTSRGKVELSQARTRLEESQALAERGDVARAATTIQRFRGSADAGADKLFTAYQTDNDPADVTAVRSFAADAMSRLTALSAAVPASDRTPYADAAALVSALDQEARVLCPQCGSTEALPTPSGLAASGPNAAELPLTAEAAAAQAQAASIPLAPPVPTAAVPTAGATPAAGATALPSAATTSAAAGKPVKQVGGAVTSALPSGVLPSAVTSGVSSVTTAVDGVVDTATGVVGGTVSGATTTVGGVLGGLTSPTP